MLQANDQLWLENVMDKIYRKNGLGQREVQEQNSVYDD